MIIYNKNNIKCENIKHFKVLLFFVNLLKKEFTLFEKFKKYKLIKLII